MQASSCFEPSLQRVVFRAQQKKRLSRRTAAFYAKIKFASPSQKNTSLRKSAAIKQAAAVFSALLIFCPGKNCFLHSEWITAQAMETARKI